MKSLDNYFKERLREHATLPSTTAWEKVEARVSKKNNKAVVLRIAAAITVIGIASVVTFDLTRENNPEQVVAEQQIRQLPAPVETRQPEVHNEPAQSGPVTRNKSAARHQQKGPQHSSPEKNIELQATVTPEEGVLEAIEAEPAVVEQPEKSKTKRIVIVYSLPAINSAAKPDVVVADTEKKTGLQKVMSVAMEVRAGESPLGELREAKDDLFAFEFRKDKNKTKN